MGADELFAGYRKHLANLLALRYQRLPRALRQPCAPASTGSRSPRPAGLPVGPLRQALPVLRGPSGGDRVSPQLHHVRPAELLDLLRPRPRRRRRRRARPSTPTPTTTTRSTTLSTGCAWPTPGCSCPGLNLAYTDRSSMAASTEVRVPFVDVEVVKAAFAVPGRAEDRRRQGKSRAQAGRAVDPAARDRAPAQGPVQRAAAGLDEPRPGADGRDEVVQRRGAGRHPDSCGASALQRLVAEDASGSRTAPSTSGTS